MAWAAFTAVRLGQGGHAHCFFKADGAPMGETDLELLGQLASEGVGLLLVVVDLPLEHCDMLLRVKGLPRWRVPLGS